MNIPWKEDARFTLYQQGLLEPLMRHLYYVSWGYFYMVLIYSSDIFKGSILKAKTNTKVDPQKCWLTLIYEVTSN